MLKTLLFLLIGFMPLPIWAQNNPPMVIQNAGPGKVLQFILDSNIVVTAYSVPGDSVKLLTSNLLSDTKMMEYGKNALNRQIVALSNEIKVTKDSISVWTKKVKTFEKEIKKLKKKKGQNARTSQSEFKMLRSAAQVVLLIYQNELKSQKKDLIVLKKAWKPYRSAVATVKWNHPPNRQ